MMVRQRWISGVAVLLLAPILPAQTPAQAPTQEGGYTVKPGDLLNISVWKEPDLTRPEVLVRPDGQFSFPLVGEVDARGKTVAEINKVVKERLGRFMSQPEVTVAVQEVRGNKVYVIGQVTKPGEFIVNPRVDVMQALSMAGGATPFAALGDITILRRTGGKQVALPFRYNDVARGPQSRAEHPARSRRRRRRSIGSKAHDNRIEASWLAVRKSRVRSCWRSPAWAALSPPAHRTGRVSPKVSVGGTYDDNYLMDTDAQGPISVSGGEIEGQLELRRATPTGDVSLVPRVHASFYNESDENSTDSYLRGDLQHRGQRYAIGSVINYSNETTSRSERPGVDDPDLGEPGRRRQWHHHQEQQA